MLKYLKVSSSLACKFVCYKPEHTAKREPHIWGLKDIKEWMRKIGSFV